MFETRIVRAFRGLVIVGLMAMVAGSIGMHALNPARQARLEMLERHHSNLDATVTRLARRNADLRTQLQALESGEAGWRDVARREFGLIGKGEVIYRFPVEQR